MGNHRFRLSDMIPNAWFYKLKDMGRTRNQNIINHTRKKKQQPITTSLSSTSSSSSTTTNTAANPPQQSKTIQPHHHHLHSQSHQRKSYYYTRELTPPPQSPPIHHPKSSDTLSPELPRKSSKLSRTTRNRVSSNVRPSPKLVTSSVSAACSCGGTTLESVSTKPDSTSEEYPNSPLDSSSDPEFGSDLDHDRDHGMVTWSSSCRCRVEKDIVIDTNGKSLNAKFDGFHTISTSELELPPIVTKKPIKCSDSLQDVEKKKKKKIDCNEPTKLRTTSAKSDERNAHGSLSVKVVKQDSINREQRTSSVRRHSVSSPGVRLRTNSPRIASRKIQAHARKSVSSNSSAGSRRSLSESLAVVKSSADPQSDFRDSMVEMILQNNIRASKDLEDLLTCYLQLNSDEYHELIIKVFKQIWFDLADVRLK